MYRFISFSHLFVIPFIFSSISSFSSQVSLYILVIKVSNFENTDIALLNFMDSIAVRDSCIKDIDSFENKIDSLMRHTNFGETNGIIVGAEFSRIFAEIILQQIDIDLLNGKILANENTSDDNINAISIVGEEYLIDESHKDKIMSTIANYCTSNNIEYSEIVISGYNAEENAYDVTIEPSGNRFNLKVIN